MSNPARYLCALLAGACLAGLARADDRGTPATIDAKELNFDKPTNMAYGKGDVVVKCQDVILRADQASFNTLTREVWAQGDVRLYRNGQEWKAPALYYNLDTHAVKTDEAWGFFKPVYLHGHQLSQIASNHYAIAQATASTCDHDQPHYRLQATHADIYTGERIVMHNCTLWLGNVPVLWIPAMIWSLTDDTPPVAINAGSTSRWGFFVTTTTDLRLNSNFDLAVNLDERTKRGFAPGANLKYQFDNGNVVGSLRGYYINDADPLDDADIAAGRALPTNRYISEWQHKQFFADDLSLTVDLNRQSDADVYNDFLNGEYSANREPYSVIDVTKRGENYTLSALARPQFNSFFAEAERLPELKWAVNRTRIGPTPVFYEGESSAGYYANVAGNSNYNASVLGTATAAQFTGSTTRMDTFHQLVCPLTFFDWLNITPRAGGRYTYYARDFSSNTNSNGLKRFVADLGTEMSFKFTRTWTDARSDRFGIDGLRHIMEPFADYQWVPAPSVATNSIFQFDTVRSITLANGSSLPVTRYTPLEFPANNAIDAISREDIVRFGLRQRLQTRRENQPWDLLEVAAWTDFHLERTDGETDFNNIFGNMTVRPTNWLTLDAFTRYDIQQAVVQEFNTDIRVSNGDRWSVGLGTRYLRDDSNLVSVDLTYRLTRRWVAQISERVDMQNGQWQDQDYVLRQELHDWYINYGFRYRQQLVGGDEKAFYISAMLKAYPAVRVGFN